MPATLARGVRHDPWISLGSQFGLRRYVFEKHT
jgi:hypothetical protein